MDFNKVNIKNKNIIETYGIFLCFYDELTSALQQMEMSHIKLTYSEFFRKQKIQTKKVDDKIIIQYRSLIFDGFKCNNDVIIFTECNGQLYCEYRKYFDCVNIMEAVVINQVTEKYYGKMFIDYARIDCDLNSDIHVLNEFALDDYLLNFVGICKFLPKQIISKRNILSRDPVFEHFVTSPNLTNMSKKIMDALLQYDIEYLVEYLNYTTVYPTESSEYANGTTNKPIVFHDNNTMTTFYKNDNFEQYYHFVNGVFQDPWKILYKINNQN